MEDFTTFLATAPVDHGATGTQPAPARFGRISVEDVTFTYPAASAPALREVSLRIAAGQVIALVGENGSGKTTLAKLLSRLYLPDSGTITWDGADTASFDAGQLRRRHTVELLASLILNYYARDRSEEQPCKRAAYTWLTCRTGSSGCQCPSTRTAPPTAIVDTSNAHSSPCSARCP